ncbi:class I SAM-dependent methyltransferase [Paenochrobactrum pullorum]|uniref:class I SAM-dependent methyltransferase n=1 Tax=Paenochrobactrum pullorum TaxID=1324351 RepID=UPI0035BBDFB7
MSSSNLSERLKRRIEAQGPITVSEYMLACLGNREDGYYMVQEPFGAEGDFITAPEISQMFGELIGVWCVSQWMAMGKPDAFILCEMGPGRGTLMNDLLRTARQLNPAFIEAATITMVETSPRLADIQRQTLEHFDLPITWRSDFQALEQQPLIMVANELFDALPMRQYVRKQGRFHERVIALDENGAFIFTLSNHSIDASLLPADHKSAPEGAIFEVAPARASLMQQISEHIMQLTGSALLIDYGHITQGYGDTLQAMLKHNFDDVFAHPGEADITSHVDFYHLQQIAQHAGLNTATQTQGEFLLSMGLLDRAGQLGRDKSLTEQQQLQADVERLAAPDQMGNLFKVLSISSPSIAPLPYDVLSSAGN